MPRFMTLQNSFFKNSYYYVVKKLAADSHITTL